MTENTKKETDNAKKLRDAIANELVFPTGFDEKDLPHIVHGALIRDLKMPELTDNEKHKAKEHLFKIGAIKICGDPLKDLIELTTTFLD